MILDVTFASCYVYSPMGAGRQCARSRLLRARLKAADAHFIQRYALRVSQQARNCANLGGFFLESDLLVPVPRSAPAGSRAWPAAQLAQALVREGLGCAVWPGLHRDFAVHKSATSSPGMRPTVDLHFESMRMSAPALQPEGIVLIDDVVTRGRTLLAASARVREVLPQARIRGFALLRTVRRHFVVKHVLEPCRGKIHWNGADAQLIP